MRGVVIALHLLNWGFDLPRFTVERPCYCRELRPIGNPDLTTRRRLYLERHFEGRAFRARHNFAEEADRDFALGRELAQALACVAQMLGEFIHGFVIRT